MNGCFQILQQATHDNETNDLVSMMNGRHPPIKYWPLPLKVVLEIYKKLNLRNKKKRFPPEKKGANSVYREPDEYKQNMNIYWPPIIYQTLLWVLYMKRECHT